MTEPVKKRFLFDLWLTCKGEIGEGPRRLLLIISIPLFLCFILPGVLFWLCVRLVLWVISGFRQDRAASKPPTTNDSAA